SSKDKSGVTFNPPMLTMGLVEREKVLTENPNVRRSSAKADAGSQSAKPSKTKTYAVRFAISRFLCSHPIQTPLWVCPWVGQRAHRKVEARPGPLSASWVALREPSSPASAVTA